MTDRLPGALLATAVSRTHSPVGGVAMPGTATPVFDISGLSDPAWVVRVMVAAGVPALRAGFTALLSREPGLQPVESSPSDDESPDAIVIDAGSLEPDAVQALGERYPRAALIVIGGETEHARWRDEAPIALLSERSDGPQIAAAIHAVRAGLTVISPDLMPALADASSDSRPGQPIPVSDQGLLTSRERQVLDLVANGYPNKTIAHELGISEHTAKFHVGSVLAKLGAASRTEAVTIATRRGILTV